MNDVINNWVILEKIGLTSNGSHLYSVKCKCEKIYKKTISSIKITNQCRQCDLELRNKKKKERHSELIGKKFNKWTVIELIEVTNKGAKFLVKCECGNKSIIPQTKFLHGWSTQCLACSKVKHGKCHTRTYNIWAGIIQRCNNIKSAAYEYYGGRGIKVTKEWFDFRNFLNDMDECPIDFELDRINPDGNYEKENCRWVSRKENANNRRRSLKNRDRFIIVDKNNLCVVCIKNLSISCI